MGDKRLQPPLPHSEPRIRVLHDDVTIDRYRWLQHRENPDVRAYLEAENSYAEQATAHLKGLKAELIAEIEGRQTCEGVAAPAFQVGPFEYFQSHERGLCHPAWWRRPVTGGSAELVLDPNAIAGAEVFYQLGVFEPSDDGRYVAFSFDLIGDERYELRVRDMAAGRDIWRDSGRARRVVWAADNHTLFLTRERSDRRHVDQIVRLDVDVGNFEVVFEEANERLAVLVRRSDSGAWLFLDVVTTYSFSVQQGAVEVWCLPSDEPQGKWRRIVKRELGHEIYAEHWGDRFLFRVDDAGPYWRLVCAPIDDPSPSRWEEVIPHRNGVTLEEVHVLEQHLVVLEREGLRPRLISRNGSGRVGATIVPDQPSCTLMVGLSAGGHCSVARHPFRSSKLTYSVSSFVTPDTVIEHDLVDDRSAVLYQARIPGYDAAQYVATVVMAEAEDGVQVPISLVARRDRTSPGPVLLNVYGCYGIPRWPSFFSWPSSITKRLSLLDRGVAFGIVHVRGGGELGRPWHEAATRDQKRITHTDLIAAAEGLVQRGIAIRDGIVIEGKSGGGGTVLATAGLRPDLFRAVLAEVPVADILDTELDFTMPYALHETAEYGDPHIAHEYRYLRSYDPYYNLSADRPLPPTYIDAALDDGQVLYYQPARYVAQRRSCAADRDPELVFRMRMVGGHSGASHGPGVAEETAFRIAWTLDQLRRTSS
ncbi:MULTISPECIES: S9 family peptidase [unclassified Mesorhizobium]|uniref:prolyl oligopeptidase family serine peptidase n=1 Tax=unclassified Mesorhizobium TaxID=325217 RepID=UPI000F7579CE|nr:MULTISPECIES: S9 family peptidase [unclassified Mesorhizobium]TGP56578.1 S9 family peptidase [bacterium M00.F.Ca.ET.230.01.1.1]TGP74930.1 S9 family peptidase [bacterium M00.F.Ca.ET.227.01.1.1]TGP85257.1 S9 family peptidase [bacterium M00.F.Ca.ET.221.01.1.1]TGP89683.1 S9 family peptidase [bacterium M00.F.Ca.ET.222.01.1.1]TGT67816.1 S9 family peptidase [bacterium M00.F.Ca.ET.159.01.1.1]TGT80256.1 S9 family peptidase [bacterium M00.F.Ca.ET.157.01.1.1]TGU05687.1 S9 family peptidase [bacterium